MDLTAYDRVQIARDANRPKIYDFIEMLFDDFIELLHSQLQRI